MAGSGIEIHPLDEGNKVEVPETKTSIGRGPFLQVTDKKVSRNHAIVEINSKGQMVLTPTHTNPCFYKGGDDGEKVMLPKDKAKVLLHNDVFGLLPDKLYFRVVYLDQVKEENGSETDTTDDAEGEGATPKKVKKQKMAMPLEKKRKLPQWMVGASKRVPVSEKQKKAPAKPRVAPRVTTPAKSKPKQGPKRSGRSRRHVSDDDYDDDYEEEEAKPPRRMSRAASQKTPKYTDDFVASGDDFCSSESSEDEVKPDEDEDDSDFVMEDVDDSGSDWAASQGSRKAKTPTRSSRRGQGRGKQRGAASRKRSSDSEFDDFLDDDEDEYVPRPSKRRAPHRKKKETESEEESEESEEEIKPKKKLKQKRRDLSAEKTSKKSRKRLKESDEDDEEEEKKSKKRKRRRLCRFGEKCYRKNPVHRKEFCHPGDASYDEAIDSFEEEQKRPTRKAALREKDKRSVLHRTSDDDGEPNTYDYQDSFLDDGTYDDDGSFSGSDLNEGDSDYDPDAEEDLGTLKKEARGFLRNKKMQKPSRYK